MPEEKKTENLDEVKVSASKLDEILARQEKLERENQILRESVDKNRLIMAESKNEDTRKRSNLKMWDYKGEKVPIIGWANGKSEIVPHPITGLQNATEIVTADYHLANGETVKNADQRIFKDIIDIAVIACVDERLDRKTGKYIWTAEYIDPELNAKYGEFEIEDTFLSQGR